MRPGRTNTFQKFVQNVAALAKITDKTTLMTVINGAVWPLVQLNVPKGFLNPMEDKKAPTSEEEKKEKVKKTVLPVPRCHLPKT